MFDRVLKAPMNHFSFKNITDQNMYIIWSESFSNRVLREL